jgi:putative sterol carrier protein
VAQPIPPIDTLASDLSQAASGEVARLVAKAPDVVLREVLGGEWRGRVLDEIFRRFPDYINADRTAGVRDAIEFEIGGGPAGAPPDRFVVVLEDGSCRAGRDIEASPRVTFELDGVDFLRLVTGDADAPIMFITGRLRIRGDELFAIEVGGFFRVPTAATNGSGGAAEIIPGEVDPIAMARAIAGTPDAELRAGMRGALRDVVLEEVFRRFPEYLDADRTRGVHAAVKWKITGRADGDADRYVLLLDDGACRIEKDAQAKPRVTITMDGADFLKLVTGNANPPMMFLRGKLKVAGDLAFAARLTAYFKIPGVP